MTETDGIPGQVFASVWDALRTAPRRRPTQAALGADDRRPGDGCRVGSDQVEAARRLDVTQPRLNDLLRGRIGKFSLDALILLAERAGLSVRVQIERAAA